ncbi:MAG: DUF4344 domain-containing metallopeptidase [Kofleriaceae bacterium]
MRTLVTSLLLAALAAPALAGPLPTVVETHGIEIEVPTSWAVVNKGKATTIAPAKFKGRGIEVTDVPNALTQDLVKVFLEAAHVTGATFKEGQRDGAPVIAATGKMELKDKTQLDVDVLAVPNANKGTSIIVSFIKGDADPVLRDANTKLLLSTRIAGPKMTLAITKPTKRGLAGVPDDLAAKLGKIGTALDGAFRLPRPLPIKVRECGVVNAFYSPTDHSISICHEFWDDTLALFKRAGNDDKKADQLARGTVMFAFFHEFGHALVGEFGLPITGKGEDAADEIATLFLGEAKQFGRESALSGASWFQTMAADPKHHNVFYDEHSFDEQRVVSITCLLYGSDQKQYGPMMKALKIPDKRLARCVRDYGDRRKAWNALLEPRMRSKKK